jgi:hypothetical protein
MNPVAMGGSYPCMNHFIFPVLLIEKLRLREVTQLDQGYQHISGGQYLNSGPSGFIVQALNNICCLAGGN